MEGHEVKIYDDSGGGDAVNVYGAFSLNARKWPSNVALLDDGTLFIFSFFSFVFYLNFL
jgi:hypothetical protein